MTTALLAKAARRAGSERGAALVEFALVLPLLMALILGLTTGGIAYNRKISMTNAVREAARFAGTMPPTMVAAPATWSDAVIGRTVDLAAGDLTTAQVCVKLVRESGSTDDVVEQSSCPTAMLAYEPATPANLLSGNCVAKVWAARPSELQALFFSSTMNLKAKAVSRYESLTC